MSFTASSPPSIGQKTAVQSRSTNRAKTVTSAAVFKYLGCLYCRRWFEPAGNLRPLAHRSLRPLRLPHPPPLRRRLVDLRERNSAIALVGIAVTPDLGIIFDTLASTRKYANLIARPACSFVIGCTGEQTIQVEGEAFIPLGSELKCFLEFYFAAWPDGIARCSWPGITHFVFRPRWLRYSDFDQSPPLIEEILF